MVEHILAHTFILKEERRRINLSSPLAGKYETREDRPAPQPQTVSPYQTAQPAQFVLVNGVLRQVTTPDRCTMQVLINGVLWPII